MATFGAFPREGHDFSAAEVGQALAGLVARDASGMPRRGWISAPTVAAAPASWRVQIGRGVYVDHQAGAARFSGISDAEQVDIRPAAGHVPTGQSRIDRIGWDAGSSALIVVEGTPAASPTPPSIGGLAPIAQVQVNAGDGMVVADRVIADMVTTEAAGPIVERRAVPTTLTGATGTAANVCWRQFATVTFATPFDSPPHLEVSAQFPASGVQFLEVTAVTETGFSGRVVRLAHTVPLAGVIYYSARPRA